MKKCLVLLGLLFGGSLLGMDEGERPIEQTVGRDAHAAVRDLYLTLITDIGKRKGLKPALFLAETQLIALMADVVAEDICRSDRVFQLKLASFYSPHETYSRILLYKDFLIDVLMGRDRWKYLNSIEYEKRKELVDLINEFDEPRAGFFQWFYQAPYKWSNDKKSLLERHKQRIQSFIEDSNKETYLAGFAKSYKNYLTFLESMINTVFTDAPSGGWTIGQKVAAGAGTAAGVAVLGYGYYCHRKSLSEAVAKVKEEIGKKAEEAAQAAQDVAKKAQKESAELARELEREKSKSWFERVLEGAVNWLDR